MTPSKKLRDLGYYFGIFERSCAEPCSCKVSYPGVNLFRIYDEGPFGNLSPQVYLMSKKPNLVGVKLSQRLLNSCSCFTGGSECYKVMTIYI